MDDTEREMVKSWLMQAQINRAILAEYTAGVDGSLTARELAALKDEADRCEALAVALQGECDE